MSYDPTASAILKEEGVALSTMMKSPCLRYKEWVLNPSELIDEYESLQHELL